MGILIKKDDWHVFKTTEIGSMIISKLSEVRKAICEEMGAGGCVSDTMENTAMNYLLNVGQIQGIDWILNAEIDDSSEDDDES